MINKLFISIGIVIGLTGQVFGQSNQGTNRLNYGMWNGITPHTGTTIVGAQTIAQIPGTQTGPRLDCFILNTGSHTFYIDFGIAATALSIPVLPGKPLYCSNFNSIENDYISLYDANAGDTWYILDTVLFSR